MAPDKAAEAEHNRLVNTLHDLSLRDADMAPALERPSTPALMMGEPLARVSTLQSHTRPEHAATPRTASTASSLASSSSTPRMLLGRFASRMKRTAEPYEDQEAVCGFLKRSTGPWSIAWWSDALPTQKNAKRTEPGRGWRPFKVVLSHDTLYFYKVPSALVPEVRTTFQIRAALWPTELEEHEAPVEAQDLIPTSVPTSPLTRSLHGSEAMQDMVQWDSPAKHPELYLSRSGVLAPTWTARIERATGSALAHEVVFGTQRIAGHCAQTAHLTATDVGRVQDKDERTFLHIAFYALGTSSVPFDVFLRALHRYLDLAEHLGVARRELGSTRRVSAFMDLLLWKKPLLHAGHEADFFREAEAVSRLLERLEPGVYQPITRQLQVWQEQCAAGDPGAPTNWLAHGAALPTKVVQYTALEMLHTSWNVPLFLAREPREIAQQIQCFHADRMEAFMRVPITAYRLASAVSETLLRSLRFDPSRPHWLTHVILRQLLVDDAPERQAGADMRPAGRVAVLVHWAAVARAALQLRDMAQWAAIAAALCSRPVVCVESMWRYVATPLRDELRGWADELVDLGWLEGVHSDLAPRWSPAGVPDVTAIPFFGNAGLVQAAAPHLGPASVRATRMEVLIAAQEPEFNRVRTLAQKISGVYQSKHTPGRCATPIVEYQCLFQRLAQHEYPLFTGVTDYMGSAVTAEGVQERSMRYLSMPSWPESMPDDLTSLLEFPSPYPTAIPGKAVSKDACALLQVWTGRQENLREQVSIDDELILHTIPQIAHPVLPTVAPPCGTVEALGPPLGLEQRSSIDLSAFTNDLDMHDSPPLDPDLLFFAEVVAARPARLGTSRY